MVAISEVGIHDPQVLPLSKSHRDGPEGWLVLHLQH